MRRAKRATLCAAGISILAQVAYIAIDIYISVQISINYSPS